MNSILNTKTLDNSQTLVVSSLGIGNIFIESPSTYPSYTLTLPINDGNPGQMLTTNGSGVLSWTSGAGGTVTSVSASVPSWLSVTVTNPTTTPAIAITGTATGTGTITVLQDGPTINNLQVNGTFTVTQNVSSGIVGTFTNDTSQTLLHNYVQIGSSNSSAMNRARFGHYFAGVNNAANYAFIQTNGRRIMFAGLANFTLPVTEGTNGQALITNGLGVTSWADVGTVTSVSATSPINSSGGATPTISLSTVPTSLGGTGLTTIGTNGQVLQSTGSSLQYVTLPTPVTSVSATSPINSSGGATPTISLSTVPTSLGGTGLTTVGTNGQVLTSNGTTLSWQTPAAPGTGTVTSVSASVPAWLSVTVTNPTTTPAIAITGLATGTGTTTVLQDSPTINNTLTVSDKIDIPRNSGNGEAIRIHNANTSFPSTNYMVIGHNSSARNHAHFGHNIVTSGSTSNYAYIETNGNQFKFTGQANFQLPTTTGTAGQALITDGSGNTSWTTMTTGTVTSVAATSPLASSGGATPTISIASSTGTGAVVLANTAAMTELTITGTPAANVYITSGTAGVGSVVNTSTLYLTQVGGGGGFVNQFIRAAYSVDNGYHISVNPSNDFIINAAKTVLSFGYIEGVDEFNAVTTFTQYNLIRSKGGVGVFGYKNGGNNDLELRFASVSTYGTPTIGMTLKSSGNVGIGTISPSAKLHVSGGNALIDGAIIALDGIFVRSPTPDIYLDINTNYGQFASIECHNVANVKKPICLNAYGGHVGIGTTTPTAGTLVVSAAGGQQVYITSPSDSYAYLAFAPNNVRKCFFGFAFGGGASKNIVLVNEYSDGGDIEINCNWASARIRCVKPILLEEAVTLRKNPSSSAFSFVFPSSMGTSGQVLTTDGTNTYWGSGGGGGGGSVNSVTASAPLASSGGTAPNISIASATGTGAVVLAAAPTFTNRFVIANTGNDTNATFGTDNGAFLSIEAHNAANSVKRPIVLNGYGGSVGIGTTSVTQRLEVVGNLQSTFDSADNDGFRHFNANNTTHLISLTRQGNDAAVSGFEGVRFIVNSTTAPNSGSEAMRITSTGLVGIGTTIPVARLHILDTASTGVSYLRLESTHPSGRPTINFTASGAGNWEIGAGAGSSTIFQNKFYMRGSGLTNFFVMDSTGQIGIGTQFPATQFHINTGFLVSNTESKFSSGTFQDPHVGTGYIAKFGNTTASNGICVKGNSRFTDTVVALGGFTTNITNTFTYEEYSFTPIIAFHTQGYNANGLIVTDVNGYFSYWAYSQQQGKVARIGSIVTITWNIEFEYANNTPNLCMIVPLDYAQFRGTSSSTSVGFPTSLDNLTNTVNYGVAGVHTTNISYNGNPRTGIAVVGREGSSWYRYYSGGSRTGQRFNGSITYNII